MDIVMGSRKWQGDVPYLVEVGAHTAIECKHIIT